MRRGAVPERAQHVAEAALDHIGWDLEHVLEDLLLQCRLVNADRATAQFHPVEHDVVVLAADLLGFRVEQGGIFRHR